MKGLLQLLILILIFFQAGCWDQQLLVDKKIVNNLSIDKAQNGYLLLGASAIDLVTKGGGQFNISSHAFTAISENIMDGGSKISRKMSGRADITKVNSILIGEKLAKADIYPILDFFYRNPTSNFGSCLALIRRRAVDLLKNETERETAIGSGVCSIISSAEKSGNLSKINLKSVLTKITDPDEDFMLPYLEKTNSEIKILGMALFHNRKFSGKYIPIEQAKMLLLLQGKNKPFLYKTKIDGRKSSKIKTTLTMRVEARKREQRLVIDKSGKMNFNIKISTKVRIVENPPLKVLSAKDIEGLNSVLSQNLTQDARKVTAIIQKANSDILGIARIGRVYNYNFFKKEKWEEVYPHININPKISIEISSNGLIK
ncbi:Ger(x)C family spore germination protein (plasmid) [Bacillus thuringiensis LM1212]|uniref:Ger(x)C family spore germination protein n=1 Tax=Bacillus thuringiensis TaxID=1428 RepID=UPI0003FAC411|nr:Ger(x)C family spore germination protein [Bacillus thuringiensis]AXY11326.1 Ger(x)C family spore germination protein [Bacillus thuringiensis LM1212]